MSMIFFLFSFVFFIYFVFDFVFIMSNKPDEDGIENVDNANSNNVTPDAEVKTPSNLSKAESLDKPPGPRLKRIIFKLMDTRKKQVLAGIIVLILIILIGGIIFYKSSGPSDPRKIAEKKCKEYTKYACDHPFSSKSSQIVLGEVAPLGMFPHMAYIEIEVWKANSTYRKCTGSLISENFVLTAGHCLEKSLANSFRVTLGVVNVSVDHPYHFVKKVYTHPLFNAVTYDYDYLLLELSEKVIFTPYLRPICLNTEYLGKYDRIISAGWGITEDDKLSPVLKSVELVIDGAVGRRCTLGLSILYTPDKLVYLICAGWPNSSRSGQGGDSGGPLQVISDSKCANTYVQIGVFSVSENHNSTNLNATLLNLFWKVANVVPWIASIVWPNE